MNKGIRGTMGTVRQLTYTVLALICVPAFGLIVGDLLLKYRLPISLMSFVRFDGRDALLALLDLSVCGAITGPVIIAAMWIGAAVCGNDRRRLARVFSPLVRICCVALALLTVLHVAIVLLCGALLLLATLHVLPLALMLAICAGAVYGSAELVRAALSMSRPIVLRVSGQVVTPSLQPPLWRTITEVAGKLNAKSPDHVILGLEPGFFATAASVVGHSGAMLEGETLYLSVTCMRLLSLQEFSAVLAHELNHFAGGDAEYSIRFLPVYQGLSAALLATYSEGGWRGIALFSARAIIVGSIRRFVRAERRIGRARELAADAAAARVAGGQAAFDAAMRMSLISGLWPATVRGTIGDIEAGKPSGNASLDFLERATASLAELDGQALVGGLVGARKSHPADTHPTLAERAQSLGASITGTGLIAEAGVASAFALLQDGEMVETQLTSELRERLLASGMARAPVDPDRPNYLQKKRLQRRAQAAARQRRMEEEKSALTVHDRDKAGRSTHSQR